MQHFYEFFDLKNYFRYVKNEMRKNGHDFVSSMRAGGIPGKLDLVSDECEMLYGIVFQDLTTAPLNRDKRV